MPLSVNIQIHPHTHFSIYSNSKVQKQSPAAFTDNWLWKLIEIHLIFANCRVLWLLYPLMCAHLCPAWVNECRTGSGTMVEGRICRAPWSTAALLLHAFARFHFDQQPVIQNDFCLTVRKFFFKSTPRYMKQQTFTSVKSKLRMRPPVLCTRMWFWLCIARRILRLSVFLLPQFRFHGKNQDHSGPAAEVYFRLYIESNQAAMTLWNKQGRTHKYVNYYLSGR